MDQCVETTYLAICNDCTPKLPMPFDAYWKADNWAGEHSGATGHGVTIAVETLVSDAE